MRLFSVPSDEFFTSDSNRQLLMKNPIDMCFIDGLHEFSQTLRDFFHIEAFCKQRSVVLIHDAIPLNRATATPERRTIFWSGDVWKAVVALRQSCRDLCVETLNCPPTGLCVITGLNPDRNLSSGEIETIASKVATLTYDEIATVKAERLGIVSDWEAVLDRLASTPV